MKNELINKLKSDFSFIAVSYIECDDGWFDLIYELSNKIKEQNPESDFKVIQIKEKFGGLRYYYEVGDSYGNPTMEKILELIVQYECTSYRICEICGKQAQTEMVNRWIKTVCQEHKQKEMK